MKKRLLTVLAAGALLTVPLLGVSGAVRAESFRSGTDVIVREDETIDRTLFASGENVEIAGTVDGDVFCAGNTVTVSGTVRGDVLCAAQTVRVEGVVEGDVRAAGQTVSLGGAVEGNATVAAQTFTYEESAEVRDLTLAAGTSTLNGVVARDMYASAESVRVNGEIGRDVQAEVSRISLGSSARVGGDVTYLGEEQLDRSNGAEVAGQVNRQADTEDQGVGAGQIIGGAIFIFLALLVVSMALAALFPRVLQRLSSQGLRSPGRTFLIGVAAIFLTPLLAFALMLTGFGVLLGLFILLAYLLLLFASGPVAGYYVGRILLAKRSPNALLYMLAGSSLLLVLYFVPILGGLVMLAAGLFGSGLVVAEVLHWGLRPGYDMSEKPEKSLKKKLFGKK